MLKKFVRLFCVICVLTATVNQSRVQAQILEAAYCEWDDQFDEWKLAINEDEYVFAVRQFGQNPYRRWNLEFVNLNEEEVRGFMQLKRDGGY